MEYLQMLRSFDADRYSLDELLALYTQAEQLAAAYKIHGMEVPEWLSEASASISDAAHARGRDAMEKELKETNARLDALKTADERRGELREKAERLRSKLAAPAAKATA